MDNASFTALVTKSTSFNVRDEISSFDKSQSSKKRSSSSSSPGPPGSAGGPGADNGAQKKKPRYRKGKLVVPGSQEGKAKGPNATGGYRDRAKERRDNGTAEEYRESQKLIEKYEEAREVRGGPRGVRRHKIVTSERETSERERN